MTRIAKPKPPDLVTLKGAYGIRTRAAAVRGRCPRPLDECAVRAIVAASSSLAGGVTAGELGSCLAHDSSAADRHLRLVDAEVGERRGRLGELPPALHARSHERHAPPVDEGD